MWLGVVREVKGIGHLFALFRHLTHFLIALASFAPMIVRVMLAPHVAQLIGLSRAHPALHEPIAMGANLPCLAGL